MPLVLIFCKHIQAFIKMSKLILGLLDLKSPFHCILEGSSSVSRADTEKDWNTMNKVHPDTHLNTLAGCLRCMRARLEIWQEKSRNES